MKRNRIIPVLLMFLTLMYAQDSLFAQSGVGETYEKALYLEESEGDLEKAIDLYEQILSKPDQDRAISAKAQLHIGLCYEKLGRQSQKQALDAFHKVVNNYPLQAEAVRLARDRLSRLVESKSEPAGFQIRKLAEVDLDMHDVSPDGRYISAINWSTVEIAVHDVKAGKSRDLTNEGTWEEPYRYPDNTSIWSPDSKLIAYSWVIGGIQDQVVQIRIVGLDGSKPRILCKDQDLAHKAGGIWVQDWSPDGKSILALLCMPGKDKNSNAHAHKLIQVSVKDGSAREIKYFDESRIIRSGLIQFSPDGSRIVYALREKDKTNKRDIFLCSIDENRETALIQHSNDDYAPVFLPDGGGILFLSDRSGNKDLFYLPLAGDKPSGSAVLLKQNLEKSLKVLGVTTGGHFVYTTSRMLSDIYTAKVDFETGNILSPPSKMELSIPGNHFIPRWSPAGKHLVYQFAADHLGKVQRMVVHDLETGEDRVSEIDRGWAGGRFWFSVSDWSPDGLSLIYNSSGLVETDRPTGFFFFNVESGESTPILLQKEGVREAIGYFPQFGRNENELVFLSPDRRSIVAKNLKTGELESILDSQDQLIALAVSPDRKEVAYQFWHQYKNRIFLKSLENGQVREAVVYDETEKTLIRAWVWHPDSRHIIYSFLDQETDKERLMRVSIDGGEPKPVFRENESIEIKSGWRAFLSIHPDGKQIAFTQGSQIDELWSMQNFLSDE